MVLTTALLIGIGLIRYHDRLADRLFPPGGAPGEVPEVLAPALAVLGCYFVVRGLSGFRGLKHFDAGAPIQIGLGVSLFFGARGLARLWSRVRSP